MFGLAGHCQLRWQFQIGILFEQGGAFCLLVLFNHGLEHFGNQFGADFVFTTFVFFFNDLAEGDRTAHGIVQRAFFAT